MKQANTQKAVWLLCLFAAWATCAAQTGGLHGAVQDEQGTPIAGATLTLKSETSATTFTAATDAQGIYRFTKLPAGSYTLEAFETGFVTNQVAAFQVAADATLELPVKLSRTPAERPQFEAAGVRGLIDPGGYSASGNAAAASGLIKGVADIERTGNGAARPAVPCKNEPALKIAATQAPQSVQANLALGEFYLEHGQTAKALPQLEYARTLDPTGKQTLEPLARAYLQAGRFETARQLLAAQTNDQSPSRDRLLAQADEGSGKFTDASRAYQQAADQSPTEENLFGIGYESILAGSPRDAEQAFAAGLQRLPQSLQLRIGLASAQFLVGHASAAIETLLHAIDLNPGDPRPYPFLSAATGTAQDHSEQVHAAFERYAATTTDKAPPAYYLALNLLASPHADQTARIEQLLRHALQLDPTLADAFYQLGVVYERQQNYSAAAQALENALRLAPNLQEAHYRLAMAYRQTGRSELSAREMQRFRQAEIHGPSQKPGAGVSIEQFISVLAKPQPTAAAGSVVCPTDNGSK